MRGCREGDVKVRHIPLVRGRFNEGSGKDHEVERRRDNRRRGTFGLARGFWIRFNAGRLALATDKRSPVGLV